LATLIPVLITPFSVGCPGTLVALLTSGELQDRMKTQKQTIRKVVSFLNNPEEEGGLASKYPTAIRVDRGANLPAV